MPAPLNTLLTTVRYYTQADPYYFTVDNRPLVDLASSVLLLANEIDRRTIAVDITGAASCVINVAPSGWSIVTNGTGDYTITHPIGNINYIATGTIFGASSGVFCVVAKTSTTIQIRTFNLIGFATHLRFNLLVTGYIP